MFDDFDYQRAAEERRRAETELQQRRGRALAELLEARREDAAAAVALVCEVSLVDVSTFGDGGPYEVELAAPPGYYDLALNDVYAPLSDAAGALVRGDYAGLHVTLRLPEVTEGWQRELLARLSRRNPGWPSGRTDPATELPPTGTDGR